jgi:DNA-binding response OmpR family regulator
VSGTILFVEDEESLRSTVSRMLSKRAFRVIQAADGDSAINLFRSRYDSIDVVFLDLTLPKRSGVEVLAELREIRKDTKVVLTSGYSRETVLSEIGSNEITGFVRKPYTIENLAAVLQAALSA